MIAFMPTRRRSQQRHDHRHRALVQRTGDVNAATDLGVPRSTARGWLAAAPTVVVHLDVAYLPESELRPEVLNLRRRVQKLTAMLRLVLGAPTASEFRLTGVRLPDERATLRILRAADRARQHSVAGGPQVPTGGAESGSMPGTGQYACALDDQCSCSHTSPCRLTPLEVRPIEEMVTAPDYRHASLRAIPSSRQGRSHRSKKDSRHALIAQRKKPPSQSLAVLSVRFECAAQDRP